MTHRVIPLVLVLGAVMPLRAATIVVNPTDPNALAIIQAAVQQDGADILISDGDPSTVDPPLVVTAIHGGDYNFLRVTGDNVRIRGESAENTTIKRDDPSVFNAIGSVLGNGFRLEDVTFTYCFTSFIFEGLRYGEATNYVTRVKFEDMWGYGITYSDYQRTNTSAPAIVLRDCLFNRAPYGGIKFSWKDQWDVTDASPYADVINCTFHDLSPYAEGAVAIDMPFNRHTHCFLGKIDSCVVSGHIVSLFVAIHQYEEMQLCQSGGPVLSSLGENVYDTPSYSPSNSGKQPSTSTRWVCVGVDQWGDCNDFVTEDYFFEHVMGAGKRGNIVDDPGYVSETPIPTNPRFYGPAFENGRAGARTQRKVVGDLDGDLDVDQNDFTILAGCISGPMIPAGPNCGGPDFDGDGDVDQADFGLFQRCFSGAKQLPPDDCVLPER